MFSWLRRVFKRKRKELLLEILTNQELLKEVHEDLIQIRNQVSKLTPAQPTAKRLAYFEKLDHLLEERAKQAGLS
jgi:hypothetical protein